MSGEVLSDDEIREIRHRLLRYVWGEHYQVTASGDIKAVTDAALREVEAAVLAKLPAPTQVPVDVEGRLREIADEHQCDNCDAALRAAYQLGLSTALERRGET